MAQSLQNGTVAHIDHAKLKKIAGRISSAKATLDEKRGLHAQLYEEAETQGFHRQALKMALKLRDMDAAKRSDFWTALNSYCEVLGVWSQGDLIGGTPGSEQGADTSAGDAALAAAG